MSEAIDWSAPIEAYHPDGRVVAVEHDYGWCIRKHLSVDDARNWSFREDGTHAKSEWRIRNRKPAQQWGDPIEVNGERPVWLGDDDLLQYQTANGWADKWWPDEGMSAGRNWVAASWHSTQRIRLAADHWVYEALRRGMVPWAGGDEAPGDWDGGDVLLAPEDRWEDEEMLSGDNPFIDRCWKPLTGHARIIGYKRRETVQFDGCTTREQAERLARHVPSEFRTTVHGQPLTQRMIDAKIKGMVAKGDGWHASFDTTFPHSEPIGPAMMKYLLEPAPEGVTEHRWGAPLDPELVDRMVEVVREFAGDDYGHNFGPVWSDVRAIAADLPPEPVDPVVARARVLCADELERQGCEVNACMFREGERDDSTAMRATIRALREGMGE